MDAGEGLTIEMVTDWDAPSSASTDRFSKIHPSKDFDCCVYADDAIPDEGFQGIQTIKLEVDDEETLSADMDELGFEALENDFGALPFKAGSAKEICNESDSAETHLRIFPFLASAIETVPRYVCNYCEGHFSDQYTFKYHLKTHTGAIPYCCSLCDETFMKGPHLKKHFETHPEKNPRCTCGHCGRTFAYIGFLKQHLRVHSGKAPYLCSQCDRQFHTKKSIENHVSKTHLQQKPSHTCSFCQKAFQYNCHLKIHLRSHTGDKPYACTFCSKRFSIAGLLKAHIMHNHSSQRPYICNHCNKTFGTSVNFNLHLNTHTREKVFSCTHCKNVFSRRIYLEDHLQRTHMNFKPQYNCNDCDKTFPWRRSLYAHIVKHHLPKPEEMDKVRYPCCRCGKSFSSQRGLKRHLRSHVAANPESLLTMKA